MPNDRIGGALLHDAAVVHDHHPVAELLHQGNIVTDEQNGQIVPLLGAQIVRLADWDKMISQPFAKYAISYLLNCKNEKLPKETMISFEM